MTVAVKKQVFEWILASRTLSKQEIWSLLEKADKEVLLNFVKIVQPGNEKQTYLPSPVEQDEEDNEEDEEDKDNEIEERPKKLSTPKEHSLRTNGNDIKEKDQHYNAKFILEQAGPTALKYQQAPKEKVVDMSTVEGIAQYVSFKFEQIIYGNHKSLVYYIEIARGLKLLMGKLRTGPNGKIMLTAKQVFPTILELTKVAESTYKSYQTFLSFMDAYPRFIHSNLTYNQIKENMGKIKAWFKAQQSLGAKDYASVKFWMLSLPEPVNELADKMFSGMNIGADSNLDGIDFISRNGFKELNPESDDEFVRFLRTEAEEGTIVYTL